MGLGARLAGLPGPDPGDDFGQGPPDAKLEAAGHPTALWSLPCDGDCAAFVGEAKARWLWALVWPAAAGVVLLDASLYARRPARRLRRGRAGVRLAVPAARRRSTVA